MRSTRIERVIPIGVVSGWRGRGAFFPSLHSSPFDWLETTLGPQRGASPTLDDPLADIYF